MLRGSLEVEFAVGSSMWCFPLKLTLNICESSMEPMLVCIVLEPILCTSSPLYRRVGVLTVTDESANFDDICAFGMRPVEDTLTFEVLGDCCKVIIV